MSHGTTASLICPACGQAFLSMQHAMEGVAQCPHCAHTAPRAHFGMQAQAAAVAQVRRRVAQSPEVAPSAGALTPSSPQPQRQSPPVIPAAPAWQAPAHIAPASIARGILQHSQALMPVGEPPPHAQFTTLPQLRSSSGRNAIIMLAFAIVCGLALWGWWDHANPPGGTVKTAAASGASVPLPEIRKAQAIQPPPPPPVTYVLPDAAAFSADAKTLVTQMFAATTPEERAACVHDGAKYGEQIEAMFGPSATQKVELRQLARIPGLPLSLPGGQPVLLYKLVTSSCPAGALLRLETGADDKRRLFWPMLAETHEALLPAFLKRDDAEPAWFHVAMRPSHGLDLPAELRAKYLSFDAQSSAANDSHIVACVERDTPLARFLDRESEWGRVYVARLLVRKLNVEADSPCMIVVDCEGAAER